MVRGVLGARAMRRTVGLFTSIALLPCLALVACSGAADRTAVGTTAGAVDAVNGASSDVGTPIATLPASAPGVSSWNVYANAAADGTATLTVLGVDGSGQLVAGAVLIPDQSVAGVGTSDDASETEAQAIGAAIASDVNGYLGGGQDAGTIGSESVHTLGNPFGLSDCTFDVLTVIGSVASTVSGTLGAFSACPVSVGVGCVAGVVMTVSGAAVGVYDVDKAVSACRGPTPLATCQAACGNIGASLPSCMTEDPYSSCYADCESGDDGTLTSFASCVQTSLAGSPVGSDSADGGADPCAPLEGCFDEF
jgi:hypothetical protein